MEWRRPALSEPPAKITNAVALILYTKMVQAARQTFTRDAYAADVIRHDRLWMASHHRTDQPFAWMIYEWGSQIIAPDYLGDSWLSEGTRRALSSLAHGTGRWFFSDGVSWYEAADSLHCFNLLGAELVDRGLIRYRDRLVPEAIRR